RAREAGNGTARSLWPRASWSGVSPAQALRSHWGIENGLHWQLDVSFREDASSIENRHGAANFALLRKLALALLKRHPRQDSIARKRKTAALEPDFLAETLAGATKLDKV